MKRRPQVKLRPIRFRGRVLPPGALTKEGYVYSPQQMKQCNVDQYGNPQRSTTKEKNMASKNKPGVAKASKKNGKKAAAAVEEMGVRAQSHARTIKVLVPENPKRKGSKSYDRFAIYKNGMTVGDFLAKGGTAGDIAYDQAHEFIKVQ